MKIIGKYKQSSKFSKFALFFSLQIFPSIVLAAHHGLLNNEGALQQISIKNSGSADSEYLVVPMNTSPGATISLQIGIEGNTAASPSNTTSTSTALDDPRIVRRQFMKSDFLARRGTIDPSSALSPQTSIPFGATPTVGDIWRLNNDLSNQCNPGYSVEGEVTWVGNNIIVVTDKENPAYSLDINATNWQNMLVNMDSVIYPTIVDKFGAPSDTDGNGKVVIFFTQGMNRLDAPASPISSYSMYMPRDKLSRTECSSGNIGEIIYALTPDPTGAINSNVRTVSATMSGLPASFTRELAHLILDSNRISSNSPFEEPWMDEAIGGMAIEQAFYANSVGLTPFNNIIVTNLTTGPNASRRVAAFNTYQNILYGNWRPWLQAPSRYGVIDNSVKTLANSGAQWAFLRYAADRYSGSSLATETSFIKSLVSSNTTGINNLQNIIGSDANIWLRDYLISTYIDDSPKIATLGLTGNYTASSWNYRSIYTALGTSPLRDIALSVGGTETVLLKPLGTSSYYRFSIAPGATASLSLAPAAGNHNGNYAIIPLNYVSFDLDIPAAANNIIATPVNQGASVQWSIVPSDPGNSPVQYTATAWEGGAAVGSCSPTGNDQACTISGLTNGVTYSITIAAVNSIGNSSAYTKGVVTVTPQETRTAQTINFSSPGQQQVGIPHTLTATATSGLDVQFSSSPGCALQGNRLTFNAAGTGVCTVTATQPGDSQWLPAQPVSYSLNVVKGLNNITFNTQANQPYVKDGTFIISPTATTTSGLVVSYSSRTPSVCSVSGTTVGVVAAGTCTLVAQQSGDANWLTAAEQTQSLQITGAVPDAPTSVIATASENQGLVRWTAPLNTGGAPITNYVVTAVGDASKTCSTSSALTCTINGLTGGTAYTFTVVATNAEGKNSLPSQPSNSITPLRRSHVDSALQAQLTGGGPGCTFESSQASPAGAVTGLPTEVQAAGPQFAFKLTGCNVRGAVQMQIDYIASLPSSSQPLEYWKKNGAGHWAKYAGAQINGNRVTLTLTDGGAGDADGIENGEIVDPGVVVRMAGPSTATPVPATAPWLIALLSLVLSVFGALRYQRRSTAL
ncbi:fibronectin type III domain-containing protein [Delftia lacustris]|uniref:fibronectin type III domain-containing protein n=1 Tax=Delftia lacustris TaxID=558537 RepID=UPI0009E39C42|nr:fibronectin type III domain-containing protein [Delftia lacustris]